MSKNLEEKNQAVTPWDYYAGLRRKEKGEFVQYLTSRFGFRYKTLMVKLGKPEYEPSFSLLEYNAIMDVINTEEWRQSSSGQAQTALSTIR